MKKVIYFLLFTLLLAGCSKDDNLSLSGTVWTANIENTDYTVGGELVFLKEDNGIFKYTYSDTYTSVRSTSDFIYILNNNNIRIILEDGTIIDGVINGDKMILTFDSREITFTRM